MSFDVAAALRTAIDADAVLTESEALDRYSQIVPSALELIDRMCLHTVAEWQGWDLARRLAYPALEHLGPVLTEDVCVPRSAVPEMLGRIEAIAAESEVVIANIAHAGDGNLHPLIVAPVVQRMHAAIKQALDPHRILNPGKAFPYER